MAEHLVGKIRLLIVDDHQVVREGLSSILTTRGDIDVVGMARDGSEAVEKARQLSPDVVLMDISMPGMNGVEATRQIKQENPQTGIVVLSMYAEEEYIFDLIRAGATGYLLKDSDSSQIANAIRAVSRGESMIHPVVVSKILSEFTQLSYSHSMKEEKGGKRKYDLSDREITVLKLVAEGKTNKEIAKDLRISEKTVKNHTRSIFHKLNVSDRTQAAIQAIKEGLIDIR
ncbi:MAG: response regulator transcription factor [Nitrospirae bacterium]|nr:response regulator transcription factor [Nitrospirota bacterium]